MAVGARSRFRRRYGASPVHLGGFLASFAVSGLAIVRFFDADASDTRKVLLWLIGGIVGHDLVFLPLYALTDRVLSRRPASAPGPARFARVRAHVRVPALLSGLLLLVFFPLILRRSGGAFHDASSLSADPFLRRWVIATIALGAISVIAYALRVVRARRREAGRG